MLPARSASCTALSRTWLNAARLNVALPPVRASVRVAAKLAEVNDQALFSLLGGDLQHGHFAAGDFKLLAVRAAHAALGADPPGPGTGRRARQRGVHLADLRDGVPGLGQGADELDIKFPDRKSVV